MMMLVRWRCWRYVLAADVSKMYRQIWVHEKDVDYQRILWRASPTDAIREYQLLTVTYGTASAPYLAQRVHKQLSADEGASFPLATPILKNQFYVDDCLFGSHDLATARSTRDQLIALMNRGGFQLRKWSSNAPELLSDLSDDDHMLACDRELKTDDALKVLGLT